MTQPAHTPTDAIHGLSEPNDLPTPANGIESQIERLSREITQNTAQLKELIRMADTELALPTLNRRSFVREASRLCLLARRHKFPLGLIYLNIDHFRRINEVYGRRGGDAVLEQLAQLLTRLVRNSDLVGRVGADEFCALLSHTSGEAAAGKGRALVELLRQEPPVYLGHTIETHVTIGTLEVDGRMIDGAMDAAAAEILEQRQHRLP